MLQKLVYVGRGSRVFCDPYLDAMILYSADGWIRKPSAVDTAWYISSLKYFPWLKETPKEKFRKLTFELFHESLFDVFTYVTARSFTEHRFNFAFKMIVDHIVGNVSFARVCLTSLIHIRLLMQAEGMLLLKYSTRFVERQGNTLWPIWQSFVLKLEQNLDVCREP